ncbi:hypothetical protein GCM10018952_17290 [Streptosporangium vulgare]
MPGTGTPERSAPPVPEAAGLRRSGPAPSPAGSGSTGRRSAYRAGPRPYAACRAEPIMVGGWRFGPGDGGPGRFSIRGGGPGAGVVAITPRAGAGADTPGKAWS